MIVGQEVTVLEIAERLSSNVNSDVSRTIYERLGRQS